MNTNNRITITASGKAGSGKTSLLILLLDMMADMGLLAHHETRNHTENPRDHFAEARVMNADSEAIEVMVDGEAILATRLALEAYRNGELPEVDLPQRNTAALEIDSFMMTAIGADATRQVIQQDIGSILQAIQDRGGPLLPITITVDPS